MRSAMRRLTAVEVLRSTRVVVGGRTRASRAGDPRAAALQDRARVMVDMRLTASRMASEP